MISEKIKIALLGSTLQSNSALRNKIEQEFEAKFSLTINELWYTLTNQHLDVILLEISSKGAELNILAEIQLKFTNIHIISLGMEKPQGHLIQTFKYGSNDFFKMPILEDLLIERIYGIIVLQKIHKT